MLDRLLTRLAATGELITHDLLDQLPQGHVELYLRHILTEAGVLAARHDLERVTPWLDQLLVDQPTGHALVVRPFAQWVLMRPARRRATRGQVTAASLQHLRGHLLLVLQFLAWLDHNDLTLSTLANHVLPEDQRWHHLRRLLNDDTIALHVRVAGVLILLFGLPVSRIRLLTVDDLIHHDGEVSLKLGSHLLPIPPRPAHLLVALANSRPQPTNAAIPPLPQPHRWLFPGASPGQPRTPTSFSRLLLGQDIDTRPARNAALIALSSSMPAPVLVDLLGISIDTAHKWATYTQPDWANYLAARTAELPHTRGE